MKKNMSIFISILLSCLIAKYTDGQIHLPKPVDTFLAKDTFFIGEVNMWSPDIKTSKIETASSREAVITVSNNSAFIIPRKSGLFTVAFTTTDSSFTRNFFSIYLPNPGKKKK